jgi:hypothetical protein
MTRSSKCETKDNLRAAFPNSLKSVTRTWCALILHHRPQLYQEVAADSPSLLSRGSRTARRIRRRRR